MVKEFTVIFFLTFPAEVAPNLTTCTFAVCFLRNAQQSQTIVPIAKKTFIGDLVIFNPIARSEVHKGTGP